eukprot:14614-Heterococcus_DN1.PRE.1
MVPTEAELPQAVQATTCSYQMTVLRRTSKLSSMIQDPSSSLRATSNAASVSSAYLGHSFHPHSFSCSRAVVFGRCTVVRPLGHRKQRKQSKMIAGSLMSA